MEKIQALKEKIQQSFCEPLYSETRSTEEEPQNGSISTEEVEVLASSEQNCILIPSYGCCKTNDKGKEEWKIYVRGWAYSSKAQSRKQKLMMGVARRVAGVNNDAKKSKTLEDRVSMFLAKNLRNQHYDVQINGIAHPSHMELDLDPDDNSTTPVDSELNDDDCHQDLDDMSQCYDPKTPSTHITSDTGHFSGIIRIRVKTVDQWFANASENKKYKHPVRWLKLSAIPEGRIFAAKSYGFANLIDVNGISIISDIDDTIKHTDISSGPRAALSSTFLYDQKEVDGMAEVYREWYDQGASIHYVSNSPWQLFPMLKQFFHTKEFPPGSAHLKLYNDLKSLIEEPGNTKRKYIRNILKDFPHRKFILVGDSGEVDMEIYSDIAKEFPEQILYVFIRDVSTERLKNRPQPPRRARSFPFSQSNSRSQPPSRLSKTMPTVITKTDNAGGDVIISSPTESDDSKTVTPTSPITPPTPTTPGVNPLQEFLDRVEECRRKVPNQAFTLFKDSKELKNNEVIKNEFLKLRK